jgi:hypothetical protein
LVNFGNGQGIDMQAGGKFPHGGELGVCRQLAAVDSFPELLEQLPVERDAAVGVEGKPHDLVIYNTNTLDPALTASRNGKDQSNLMGAQARTLKDWGLAS